MLEAYPSLLIEQQVEPLQVFTGLETKNRYRIIEPGGSDVLYAYEESGFMGRQFLGTHRPLSIKVVDSKGVLQLTARRRFFWLLSHLELLGPNDELIGRVDRRLKLIGRRFEVRDAGGTVATLDGPTFRPNTFWLRGDGRDMAKITKRWSGIGREAFTAADSFEIEFSAPDMPESMRRLVLGAAFAIDLDFFERRGRGGLGFGMGGR